MLDLKTPIILNGEHETTIAEFLADNADGFQDCEALCILMALTEDGFYHGDDGAIPGFYLEVV